MPRTPSKEFRTYTALPTRPALPRAFSPRNPRNWAFLTRIRTRATLGGIPAVGPNTALIGDVGEISRYVPQPPTPWAPATCLARIGTGRRRMV
jgi:hypothetical protein